MSVAIGLFRIYQIVDPRDRLPFYVGLTANIEECIKQHMGGDNANGAKYECIAELKGLGLAPIFEELERIEGTLADARQREMYWIRYKINAGARLLNTGVPIDEPTKYTTHLLPSTIKAIKVFAAAHDLKDYEVVQAAISEYLEKQKDRQP